MFCCNNSAAKIGLFSDTAKFFYHKKTKIFLSPSKMVLFLTVRFQSFMSNFLQIPKKQDTLTQFLPNPPNFFLLEHTLKVLEHTLKVLEDVPRVLEDVPGVMEDVPKVLEDVPRVLEDVPEVLERVPMVLEDVPEVLEDVPKVLEDVPKVLTT